MILVVGGQMPMEFEQPPAQLFGLPLEENVIREENNPRQ